MMLFLTPQWKNLFFQKKISKHFRSKTLRNFVCGSFEALCYNLKFISKSDLNKKKFAKIDPNFEAILEPEFGSGAPNIF